LSINATQIKTSIATVEQLLKDDTPLSPTMRSAITLLMVMMQLLLARIGLDSHNSSKPPASDPHREPKVLTPSERTVDNCIIPAVRCRLASITMPVMKNAK
jgi:transposase